MRQNNRLWKIKPDIILFQKTYHLKMKKTSLRCHPLQQCIDSYHKSLLGEARLAEKGEENKLKKISRNRLVIKQPSFPVLKEAPSNKQNQQPRVSSACQKREKTQFKVHSKNLSFFKHKPAKLQHNKSKLILSQNLQAETPQQQKIRELSNKKFTIIREKKLVPSRNCASAELKKDIQDSRHLIPQKIREIRRVNHMRKSKQLKESEEGKHLSILVQAQRLAYEGRKHIETNQSAEKGPFVSLQDFLNEWKTVNIR